MRKHPECVPACRGIHQSRIIGCVLLASLTLVAVQCRGSGGGSDGTFDVISISATRQSPELFLNDGIEIIFSRPVDPQTVFSGIHIYPSVSAGGRRADGEFMVEGNKVTFTPRLPTNPSFTDGGFLPDTEYSICIPRAHDSCSVFIQNAPGIRSVDGRACNKTRRESFRTVALPGGESPFRPERAPRRPEVIKVVVSDNLGVEQVVNPITHLISGQTFQAGVLTTIMATPASTVIPGTSRKVPVVRYLSTPLTRTVSSPVDISTHVTSRDPLVVTLSKPNRPIMKNEFQNRGGVLTIRDSSSPPVEASWAVDSNTEDRIVTLKGSGPPIDTVEFKAPPCTAVVSQGITRRVAPGDVLNPTEVKITLSEVLNPRSTILDNFSMARVVDSPEGLKFTDIPPAPMSSNQSPGITHEIINGKSVVTLRPRFGFPKPRPEETATILVFMKTAQEDNASLPSVKHTGLRDLNDFPLAYPVRTGWVLNTDPNSNPCTIGYIQPFEYTGTGAPPKNIRVAWGFQTRDDVEVLNAVVEPFLDTSGRGIDGKCRTTASWTRAGEAGLFATYGYGGDGSLGSRVVQSAITLDSDTMVPGPDGVVNFNYDKLILAASGTISLKGRYPIRINALGEMTIEGTIDGSGKNGMAAPPGKASAVGIIAGGQGGPGGGAGGDSNTGPRNVNGALPMELRGGPGYPRAQRCTDVNKSDNRLLTPIEKNCGGGTGGNRGLYRNSLQQSGCSGNGGGHMTAGKKTDYLCTNIGSRGQEPCISWITDSSPSSLLHPSAGTGGGAGGNAALITSPNPSPADDIVAGSGGGAGGGLELQCGGTLTIKSSAVLLAKGGNGGQGYSTVASSNTVSGGYGAGGAGGSLWLSGTSVVVETSCTLDASGGVGNPGITNPDRTGNGGDGYIIIRDRGGSPDIKSSNIMPAVVPGRNHFDPPENGKSWAFSKWYDSGEDTPHWSFDSNNPLTGDVVTGKDLLWYNPPDQGQKVKIMFQGAPDMNGIPDPDPATWIPKNTASNPCQNWEADIDKLRIHGKLRHIRFRVEFDIGKRDKGMPVPNPVAIYRIMINFGKPGR